MMVEHTGDTSGRDPLGLRLKLEFALRQPELGVFDSAGEVGEAARKAAYRVAIALGDCRLFDIDAGTHDGTLSPAMASAAAQESQRLLAEWRTVAGRLGETFDLADEPIEAEGLCCDMLACRMQAWAVFEALRESFLAAAHDRDACAAEVTRQVGAVSDAIEAFDAALLREESLLSVATGTELLNNWRARLAEKYKADLPWWLDGRLETAAERSWDETLCSQPGERAWREHHSPSFPWLEIVESLCTPPLAAASKKRMGFHRLLWHSPGREFEARIDRKVSATGDVIVRFFDVATGAAAIALKGTNVSLASVPSRIEERGVALFPANKPFRKEEQPDLIVGDEGTRWIPVPVES